MTRGAPCAIIFAGLARTMLILFRTSCPTCWGCRIPCASEKSGCKRVLRSVFASSSSRSESFLPGWQELCSFCSEPPVPLAGVVVFLVRQKRADVNVSFGLFLHKEYD